MPSITITVPTITIPTIPISATLNGGADPFKAQLSGPNGKEIAASLGATVGGTGTPIGFALDLGGTATPIALEAGFRNNTVQFKLFGFIPLLTIKIR